MAYSPKLNTSISAPNKLEIYWINKPMNPTAMAMRAVFLYPIFTSILPEGIPINRYARKFIIFPIIPKVLAPAYWFFHIVPKGAARLVTKEIIAKRKNIVMIAMILPFCFC